jgi:hypothetical protein
MLHARTHLVQNEANNGAGDAGFRPDHTQFFFSLPVLLVLGFSVHKPAYRQTENGFEPAIE